MDSDPEKTERHDQAIRKGKEEISNSAVLYLVLVSAYRALLVDDHAQGSPPTRELLA
jgi:hypothetical protein